MDRFNAGIRQNSWILILTAIAASFVFPVLGNVIKPYLNYLLMILMFLSCLDLKIDEIAKSLHDVKNISLMLLIVHLVSPLIIFLFRDYFAKEVFLGLVIAATIPAGRSAVFLSHLYGGSPIKALVSTSISNALSPLTVPLFVWLFAHTTIKIDPLSMSSTIFWLVVIPLLFAVFIGKSSFGKRLNTYSPSISVIILFLIIVGIISPLIGVVTANIGLSLFLGLFITILIIIDFFLGYLLGKDHADHVTYAISSSYKNYTLGTLLSLTVFTPTVALPSIIYTVVSNVLLAPLQFLMSPRRPSPHRHHRRKHRNLIYFCLGLVVTLFLANSPIFKELMTLLYPHLIIAAFIGGLLFASTFTIATGALILLNLALIYPILPIIIFAGLGAAGLDIIIFLLFKDRISEDITAVYRELSTKNHLHRLLHTRYFAWTLPVLGALIIASPLPDELGVSLMGLSKMDTPKFIFITLISHFIGVFTLLAGSRLL